MQSFSVFSYGEIAIHIQEYSYPWGIGGYWTLMQENTGYVGCKMQDIGKKA